MLSAMQSAMHNSARHTANAASQQYNVSAAAFDAAAAAATHLLSLYAVCDAVGELVFKLLKLLTQRIQRTLVSNLLQTVLHNSVRQNSGFVCMQIGSSCSTSGARWFWASNNTMLRDGHNSTAQCFLHADCPYANCSKFQHGQQRGELMRIDP
jgi:hypothetical protein